MLGMHGTVYSNYAINEADLLLALGVRFDDRVTGKLTEFAKHGKIVHIDIDQSRDPQEQVRPRAGPRRREATRSRDLIALLEGRAERRPRAGGGRYPDWMAADRPWRDDRAAQVRRTASDAIIPQYAIQRLWEILRDREQLDDTIITTGVGQHQMWAAQFFHFNKPRKWITSGGLGTMGFGLPAALGAKVAHPDQPRHRHRRRRQLPDERAGTGHRLRREDPRRRCCCSTTSTSAW